jgi:hypothetical protein
LPPKELQNIFPLYRQFAIDVLSQLKPSVIFSAHDHKGMDYIGTKKTGKSNGTITFFSQQQVVQSRPVLHYFSTHCLLSLFQSDSTPELLVIRRGDQVSDPKTGKNLPIVQKFHLQKLTFCFFKSESNTTTGDASNVPEEYVHEIVVPTCSYR